MLDELLPIGSIIGVKDSEKKLMIIGIMQKDADSGDTYDYSGVLYPEGNLGPEYQYLFNSDIISEVFYMGYESEERDYFINNLKKVYEPENAIVNLPDEPLEEEKNANLDDDDEIF